jgi:hypothetical protein
VTASPTGEAGILFRVETRPGRALAVFTEGAANAVLRVRAATAGPGGTGIRVSIADSGAGGVNVTVEAPGNPARNYNGLNSIAALVQALSADPAIAVERLGNVLPAPTAAPVPLAETVTVTVREEGQRRKGSGPSTMPITSARRR